MPAPFKQINADSLSEGADASGLFDALGGTTDITARAASSPFGGKGLLFHVASAVSNFGSLNYTAGSQPGAVGIFQVSGAPGGQSDLARITASGTVMGKAVLTTGKVFQIQDAAGTVRYASAALADGWYWYDFKAVKGASTSTGHMYGWLDQLVIGTPWSWSAVSIGADPGAVCNCGTVDATVTRTGRTGTAGTFDVAMDRVGITQGHITKTDTPTLPSLVTDAEGLTDAAAGVKTSVAAVTDTEGLSDTATGSRIINSVAADTMGMTDTPVGTRVLNGAATDALGLTDTSDIETFTITDFITDPMVMTDTPAGALEMDRTQADALGLTDDATGELASEPIAAGEFYVSDGTNWVLHDVFISDGVTWVEAVPAVSDGTVWE